MRRTAIGLALLCILLWIQQGPLWTWVVEDSAISFAYARHLVEGLGLVPYPGAERVEGYSNPSWVALLALAHALGADLFTAARLMGAVLSAATVVLVFAAARRLLPDRPELPWLAAGAVALDAQHVIWGTSGLENPLFSALLAAAAWRVLVDRPGQPWAPLAFLALALTRPEGGAYALVGGAVALAQAGREGARAVVVGWLRWALAPLLVVHAVRFAYFAMEMPATYYAKLGDLPFDLYKWKARSWLYLRQWASTTGSAFWVPVVALGMVGSRGWRVAVVGVVTLLFALAYLPDPAWVPVWVQVWLLLGCVVAIPLLSAAEGRSGRVLVWGLAAVAFAFSVRSGGDWMRGFRWMALATVPLALLFALGVSELVRAIAARVQTSWVAWIPVALAIPTYWAPRIVHLVDLSTQQVATPWGTQRRLSHYEAVLRRKLWLDRQLTVVDHDMGGLMFWGGDAVAIHDARGLIDLPFAVHQQARPFVLDYLFTDDPPDMAHAHASTRKALRFAPRYRQEFVEVPGYGRGPNPHGGQMIWTGLFLRPDYAGPTATVQWEAARLQGVRVPSPEVAAGAGLFVELAVSAESREAFRTVLILARPDGLQTSWDLPPAHDWVEPKGWRDQVFVGRFSLVIPEGTPEGRYQLRLAVIDAQGRVAEPVQVNGPVRRPASPVWADGEVRLPGVVQIVSGDEMAQLADEDRTEALENAEARRCNSAEESWERALRHRTRSGDWRAGKRPEVASALARCWALRGGRGGRDGEELLDRVANLERARGWDPREPEVHLEAQAVSAEAWGRGLRARVSGDTEGAFTWFDAAARAEPSFAWARRYAEQARAARLELDPIPGPHWPLDPPVGPR